jgi:hypothetical protein
MGLAAPEGLAGLGKIGTIFRVPVEMMRITGALFRQQYKRY